MPATKEVRWLVNRGRNGYDIPSEVADDMSVEAINVVLVRGTVGQKRHGSDTQAFTGDTFSGYNYAVRFIPGQNDAAAELIFVDRSGTPKIIRVAAGTVADELTLADAISSLPQNSHAAILNGKLFIAYDSAVNNLHVFDPSLSTTTVRKTGLPTPAAATAGNTGSGSYGLTLRYYKVAWLLINGGNNRLMSNLSLSVSFTPTGTPSATRVTQPSPPSAATHWIVYGSADDTVYYQLSGNIAVATTTYDDSVAPADYPDGEAAPVAGSFTNWPSVKFLLSTGERLIGFGAWETATGDAMPPKNGRVYFSPVIGTSSFDDEERVSNSLQFKGYIDLARDAGAEDRALIGPMDGQIFAFQSRGSWMLVPTTNAEVPFRRITLSNTIGAVSQWSTFAGEDEAGLACVYWLDPERGPYRYGPGGLQWIGYDVQDIWKTVNLSATGRVATGIYDPVNRRCIWAIATGASNDPDTGLVFQVREGNATRTEGVRKGWTVMTGAPYIGRTMFMFSETFAATMSRNLKPYSGLSASLLRGEVTTADDDAGTTFQAYVTSKAWGLEPLATKKTLGNVYLQAATEANVSIELALIRNYGDIANNASVQPLTPAGDETRILKQFVDADLNDMWTFQMQAGDSDAVSSAWTIDRVTAAIEFSSEQVGNNLP